MVHPADRPLPPARAHPTPQNPLPPQGEPEAIPEPQQNGDEMPIQPTPTPTARPRPRRVENAVLPCPFFFTQRILSRLPVPPKHPTHQSRARASPGRTSGTAGGAGRKPLTMDAIFIVGLYLTVSYLILCSWMEFKSRSLKQDGGGAAANANEPPAKSGEGRGATLRRFLREPMRQSYQEFWHRKNGNNKGKGRNTKNTKKETPVETQQPQKKAATNADQITHTTDVGHDVPHTAPVAFDCEKAVQRMMNPNENLSPEEERAFVRVCTKFGEGEAGGDTHTVEHEPVAGQSCAASKKIVPETTERAAERAAEGGPTVKPGKKEKSGQKKEKKSQREAKNDAPGKEKKNQKDKKQPAKNDEKKQTTKQKADQNAQRQQPKDAPKRTQKPKAEKPKKVKKADGKAKDAKGKKSTSGAWSSLG